MGSKVKRETKERNKMLIIFHETFVKIINEYKEEDYHNYQIKSRIGGTFIDEMFLDYENNLKKCGFVNQKSVEDLSVFDRAICFGMCLKEIEPIMITGTKTRSPKRFQNVNERFVAEAMLRFIEATLYRVVKKGNHVLCRGVFNYDCFNDGHKKELESFRKLLIANIEGEEINYIETLALLNKIYVKGVIYDQGLEGIDEARILENLKVTEKFEVKSNEIPLSEAYKNQVKMHRFKK